MKYSHSLRNRILIAFCVFGLILSLTYWLLIDITMSMVEDLVFENRIKNEITSYMERRRNTPGALLPNSRYIRSFIGLENMPELLKEMAQDLEEGFYETDGPNAIDGPLDYHVAVKKIEGQDELFYLFFDVGTLKLNEEYETIFRIILFFTSIIVAGIGAGIGLLISRKVIAPLTELADHVANSEPDNLPMGLSDRFADDEIGFLAQKLEQSMHRIDAFIRREKEFTRYASHELRTPVTVIKGAIELIEQSPAHQEKSVLRPVKRIKRSVQGMALTIDTFLWLAREDAGPDVDQTCDVLAVSREAFQEHQKLFMEKMLSTEFVENAAPVVRVPAVVFGIVVNNLLRNAFSHTPEGKIRMVVNASGIEVYNSGFLNISDDIQFILDPHVIGKDSNGFGFGLAIVNRLCERFQWQLNIASPPDGGTLVTLAF